VFLAEIENIFLVVLLHNAFAFLTGFSIASIFRLPLADTKTITVETGIQNSGLGLVLIFNYFNGNPDMALIAAWWGVWHIVSGFGLSLVLKRL
jgi:BASS family bile acid:Na+ symporter